MALNTGTYNITPGQSQKELDARRQMAYMLWKESMDPQPIRHWLQGAGQLAKAVIAGNELYQADESDRRREKAVADALNNLPGMGAEVGEVSPDQRATAAALRGDTSMPASIRTNNPGAQWPGPSASAQGSTGYQGVAGNNKIATFPDAISGGAAQFDLLNRGYTNMPLAAALKKWSGGNNADAYTANVTKATGLSPDTVITADLLRSPQGIELAKAMARHEAGRDFQIGRAHV